MRFSTFPDMPFNQEVSFPCELTLHHTPKGLRVFRQPIREIELLHQGRDTWANLVLKANEVLPLEPSGRSYQIQAQVAIPEGATLTFNLRGIPLIIGSKTIESGDSSAVAPDGVKSVEILGGPRLHRGVR